MAAIKFEKFGGMLPSWNDLLLPEGQASLAVNTYLFSGALIGWRKPKLLHALKDGAAKFAYRVPNKTTNDTRVIAADSFWMEFADADTNVIRTPVVGDSFQRYYFASPSQIPQYNTYDRIIAGQTPWTLGVPAPACNPGVVVTGGGDAIQIGNSTAPIPGVDTVLANTIALIPIVPTGTLLLQDIAVVVTSTNTTADYQGVLYSDLNGTPYQLIGSTATVQGTADGQITCPFTNPIPVQPNTTYWIGVATDTDTVFAVADTTYEVDGVIYARGVRLGNSFNNGPPDTAGTASKHQPNWQIWGDFTGASVFEARSYVYTWVTAYGEEGPPSLPSLVHGWSNASWTLSLFTPPLVDMGTTRNITKKRIYRTITSNLGLSAYFLVAELPITDATYVDNSDDAVVALNFQMESLFWFGPPADLQGILAMPNGIGIGFRSNEIWFTEAYRPHAWPPGYVLTTEFPIVGIGVCGQSAVICTEKSPYIVTGVNPASMSLTKIDLPEPCVTRGSIVSTDTTVLYTSLNGLIQVSQNGSASNVTEPWITRERWAALAVTKNLRAIKLASSYFAFGTVNGADNSVAQVGFTVELSPGDQQSFTIWPQPGGHRLGFCQLTSPNAYDIINVEVDPWTGVGLLVQNGGVYYYDFTDTTPATVPYKWRSKIYQQRTKKNFEAVRVFFTVPSNTPAQSVARNTAAVQAALGAGQYALVRVYADGTLFTTREVRTSGELLRVLSGSKVEQWQLEIEGVVNISNVQMATSVKELGAI